MIHRQSEPGKPIFSVDIHPDGTKFATGGQGQDSGKVVIWNMAPVLKEEDEKNENIPKMLCQMDNHLACVNCVRWSNNGVYLASGGDDKLIMVWKRAAYIGPSTVFGSSSKLTNVEQWRCVSILRSHSGDVMDVAWSPHDAWLASCSVDNTVVIWNAIKFPEILATLKGHSGLVKGLTWDPVGKYIASQADDRSLKVWRTMDWQLETSITKPFDELTCLKRPLVVIHELFDKSIMDISWTLNGLGILVCSMDGSVAFLDFSQDELGDPLSEEEKSNIHQSTYGKSLAIMTEAQLSTTIIENPEMLKYQQRQQQQQVEQKNASIREGSGTATAAPKVASMVNGESLEDIRKNLLKKQVETRTADGRRRITPLCIAQLDTGDFSTAFFNSIPISGSLSGSMMSSQSNQQLMSLDSNAANSLNTSKPSVEPTAASIKPTDDTANKDGVNATSASTAPPASSSSVLTTPSKIEPMKAFDSRFTERSKATSGTAVVTNTNQTVVDRLKDQNLIKDNKPKDILESSSDSEEKIPAAKPLSAPKRKLELEGETVEKKKKGRPRKDSRLVPVTLTVQSPATLASEKDAACISAPALALKLPTPIPQKSFTLQVSSDPSMYLEVENEMTTVGGSKLSRLKCNREGKEWETVLTSRILTAAGSCEIVSVACEKRTLSVFSACGRRLLPPIILNTPISTLHCTGSYVMALTTAATLSVWDVHKQTAIVRDESLQTIFSGSDATVSQILLTQHGIPVMSMSDGKAYCFNPSLSTWNLVSDKQDSLAQCADFRNSLPSQEAMLCSGPLAVIQGRTSNSGRQAARLFSMPHLVQQETTLAYLENQIAAALMLQSSHEYRHWLLIYARYLVNEGFEYRLRELCKDLLGPVHYSAGSQWESTVMGLRKRELLKELLPVIGQNLRFQRLFTEYQEQLDILRDK
ncbi:protein HIRA isoform X4 [Egretta garzetta]|uniref:protein HIRA isoform X4 n=1 Tax=Egretta garzetta TaxID=188379 RepID=UPI00163D3C46|nr:protein HIRA isoform X4 [Egretta garzetta]